MTIKELAKLAGLSHSTVSRCLNDSPLIPKETKDRVLKLADEHNFQLNAIARGLITKKTGTIGVIFPELDDEYRNLQYLGSLMNSLRYTIEEEQYDSIITFPRNPKTGRSNIRKLIGQRKVDGLLLVLKDVDEADWKALNNSGLPFIAVHFRWINEYQKQISYVYPDHVRGGFIATECLVKSGCRKIISLSERGRALEFTERTEGYRKALEHYGLDYSESDVYYGVCGFEYGYNFVMENPDVIGRCDGIFAQADMIAIGAVEAMKEIGIRVPQDVKVVGYDDIDIDYFFKPRITTVHQPREMYTRIACRKLIRMIEDEGDSGLIQRVVEPTLIVRESCVIHEEDGSNG